MNRRQAKKKLKADYSVITPRQANPRLTKKYTLELIEIMKNKIVEYTEHVDNLILYGEQGSGKVRGKE